MVGAGNLPSSGERQRAILEWMARLQPTVRGSGEEEEEETGSSRLKMLAQIPQSTSGISECSEYFNKSAATASS